MTDPQAAPRPRRDWSRVSFAVFFLLLALAFAFAQMPMVADVLRIVGYAAGAIATVTAWQAGRRGIAVVFGIMTIVIAVMLPTPPVPSEKDRSVQWLFLGLGVIAVVVSVRQVLRDGDPDRAPERQGSSGT